MPAHFHDPISDHDAAQLSRFLIVEHRDHYEAAKQRCLRFSDETIDEIRENLCKICSDWGGRVCQNWEEQFPVPSGVATGFPTLQFAHRFTNLRKGNFMSVVWKYIDRSRETSVRDARFALVADTVPELAPK